MSESKFVECLCSTNQDITVGCVYRVVPDPAAEAEGLVRIVDESGEDYLYPAEWFEVGEKNGI